MKSTPKAICEKIAKSISENPSEWKYRRLDKRTVPGYEHFPSLQHKRTGIRVSWTFPTYFAVLFQDEEILKLYGWNTTNQGNSVQGSAELGVKKSIRAKPLCDILIGAIQGNFDLSPIPDPDKILVPIQSLDTVFVDLVDSL